MRKVRKALGLALALTVAVSMLAGCGGGSAKEPEVKDTLTVAITGDPPTLDLPSTLLPPTVTLSHC